MSSQKFHDLFGKVLQKGVRTASIPLGLLPAPTLTKDEFLQYLQEDLSLEYAAALQYLQHYAVIKGAEYEAVRPHLLDHAHEEIAHAVKIADRISFLGGTPLATVAKIEAAPGSREMLSLNLSAEKVAVTRYKERVVQALSLGEFGAADMLMGILQEEEEHANDLMTSLGDNAQEEGGVPVLPEVSRVREERRQQILSKLAGLKK